MKKFRFLLATLLAIDSASSMKAQSDPEAYAVLSNGVSLTFYYNTEKSSYASNPENEIFDLPWGLSIPGWTQYDGNEDITYVEFDGSFANYHLQSTAYMFWGLANIEQIHNLKNLNTDEVRYMTQMFCSCERLNSLDLSTFDTKNVTNMAGMFQGCESLSSLTLGDKFVTSNVTDMHVMFSCCSSLRALDLSNFDTKNVTNMSEMFLDCTELRSLDVSSFKTDNVTNMYQMFYNCNNLGSIDVSKFNTENVKKMHYMFCKCSSLTSIDLSNFNTDQVESMMLMFQECSSLKELDLRNFNIDHVGSLENMFYGCSSLETIYCAKGTNWSGVNFTTDMFTGCVKLQGRCGTKTFPFDSNYTDGAYAKVYKGGTEGGYFSEIHEPYAVLDGNTLTFYYDPNKPTGAYDIPWSNDSPGWSNNSSIQTVTFDASFDLYHGLTSTEKMFKELSHLQTINHLEYLHTENVTNMRAMFSANISLTSIDVSNFNVSKVTDMSEMFAWCTSLETIYCAPDADWSGVNNRGYNYMFSNCPYLTGKCGNKTFSYNSSYPNGDYARVCTASQNGYFTSIVETYEPYAVLDGNTLTFYYDNNKPTGAYDMNWGIGFPGWTNDGNGNNTITTVTFDASFDDYTELSNAYAFFKGLSALTTINHLEYLHTDNVTDMARMFHECSSLTSLDLSTFNTGNVTQMMEMFFRCSNLETIYCAEGTDWSTNSANKRDMFSSCSKLKGKCGNKTFSYNSSYQDGTYAKVYTGNDEVGGYFTSIVETYVPYAVVSDEGATLSFYYDNRKSTYESDENVEVYNIPWKCDEERDVPGWTDYTNGNNKITTAVFDASFANYHGLTSTYNMFAGLFKLKNIENLNYLNTENVTNMKYMFWSCEKLITLDVSNFNVSNVTDMGQMFACCSRLKTIYCAPDANWSNEHYKSMFTGCDLLSGKCRGMEFKYSATYVHTEDGYYARVYTGDDEVGGYFTSIAERKGDANGDGVVDAVDFNMIANEILGYHQDNFDRVAADINGDNEIDAIDFNMIANKILYGSFSGEQGSKKNKGKTKETESEDSKEPM